MAVASASVTKKSQMDNSKFTPDEIQQELEIALGTGKTEVTGDDETLVVKFLKSGRTYEIDNFYNVEKDPSQENSEDIGIGENGEQVNLDLWKYTLQGDGTYMLNAGYFDHNTPTAGYIGDITDDGKIEGVVPAYIKSATTKKIGKVTSLRATFCGYASYQPNTNLPATYTNLAVAPSIPSSVTDMSYAFYGCQLLTESPIIPEGVTNLEETFSFCRNLTKVQTLPNSVTNMTGTFDCCAKLEVAPAIPNNITELNKTFEYCSSLTTTPTIPDSVTDMTETFYDCVSLTNVTNIGKNVTNMNSTFRTCRELETTPIIPEGVTNMYATFANCTSLTIAPTIPNSVTNMSATFAGCAIDTAPTIPNGVNNLDTTFKCCEKLRTPPTIPNGVTNMAYMFEGCTNLITAPAIPSSVTNMTETFSSCENLKTPPSTIPSSVTNLTTTFGGCSSLTGNIEINAFTNNNYSSCFYRAATNSGCNLIVTGSSSELDAIIATKSSNSNISKGE